MTERLSESEALELTDEAADDMARLETSLTALRRDLLKLDNEIDAQLEALIRKRRHLVEVVWTVKDAMGEKPVDLERELEIDRAREMMGVPAERVAVLRAIRLASRPNLGWEEPDA